MRATGTAPTPLTVMLVLVAVTRVRRAGLHAHAAPYFTRPLVRERSVAQLTVAVEPTTSVRYG